jgi:2-hydroxycyclohexanecarboxyl-CoA dehydrogenase
VDGHEAIGARMTSDQRRRLVLVSGGSGAIGAAICRRLHDEGWGVAIGYVSHERAEDLARSLHADDHPAVAVPLDLADSASIRSGVAELHASFGRVDAVVFNGGLSHSALFVDTTERDWWTELAVNFTGPMLVTKLCLPAMMAAGHGVFVGVTSEAAKVGDIAHAPYSMAKAALNAFFKTIVHEYGRRGIRACSVAPGPIDTPMMRYSFDTPEEADQAISKLISLVPLKRFGLPDEVAAVVRFLCSDGEFVAGEQLSVGGGISMQ